LLEQQRATRDGTERQRYIIYTLSNSQLVLPYLFPLTLKRVSSVIAGWFSSEKGKNESNNNGHNNHNNKQQQQQQQPTPRPTTENKNNDGFSI
jgi:hypothetical protein